jgi:DNA-binding GntR family transcriptional regulator
MIHRTKKDYALALIRELIVAGDLDPGTKLHQVELAQRLNISLTPVREALRQLEAEGLVASNAHHGVRVSTANPAEVRDVYIMRRLLEPYAAARGVQYLHKDDCRLGGELLAHLDRCAARGDERGFRKANMDFHFLLYERAQVALLVQSIRMLWARFPWDTLSVIPSRVDSSLHEHRAILEAMERRDPIRVAAATEKHIVESFTQLDVYFSKGITSDPFIVTGPVHSPFQAAHDGLRATND